VALRKRTDRRHGAGSSLAARAASGSGLALRDEKILVMLAMQSQQINDRLTRLEERFEASLRDSMAQPDQQDLLELRLHSARLAAELSRVTIELRAEINELASNRGDDVIDLTVINELGSTDTADASAASAVGALPHRRVDDLVAEAREPVTRVRPRRTGGWKPVRSTTPLHETDDD
jgi:hypothetical protein